MWTENLRKLIEGKFKDNWTATDIKVVDFGDNSNFKPPKKGAWCRVQNVIYKSENAEIGTRFQRQTGAVVIQCFVDKLTGESEVNKMVDEAIEIFQNQTFDNLSFRTGMPVRLGEVDNWCQVNAKIEFVYNVFS